MYDADVFAVITAHDTLNLADSALRLERNSKWFSKAAGGVALEPTLNSRETTPADDTQLGDVAKKEVFGDRLVVTFSKLLESDNFKDGLQLGTNPISSALLQSACVPFSHIRISDTTSMSIWKGIDRAAFERDIAELRRIDRYQQAPPQNQASSGSKPSTSVDDAFNIFPMSVEKQLATDMAILAAWQPAPAFVSAASIHLDPDLLGLVVTLSANEGIASVVQAAFTKILTLLRTCATRSLSGASCSSACLEVVVELHRNRILGRLGSQRFIRPKGYQLRTLVQVGTRVRSLANVPVLRRQTSQACSDDIAKFKKQLGILAAAIDTIENVKGAPSIQNLIAVVHAAFEATIDGVSLARRLLALGYPPETISRAEVRQVQSLGRYSRICSDLASLARSYRQNFANARLDVIQHNPVEIWPPASSKKHYVHAEIQMLVHHQLSPTSSQPRCIGTSKSACFLCYCFLSAHGQYSVTETHGEVFEQWTVPDNSSHTPGVRKCLSDALQKTAIRTSKAMKASRKDTRRHAPPMQSVLDLCLQHLRTPSASTLISRSTDNDLLKRTAVHSASDRLELSPNDEAGSVSLLASADPSTSHTTDAMVPTLRPSGSIASDSRHTITSSITGTMGLGSSHTYHIDRGRSARIQADGVEMFVELDDSVVDEYPASALCVVRKVHSATARNVACPVIEIATLVIGEPRTFDIGNRQDRPGFVLIRDEHFSLAVALKWDQ
ncbi:hypothetical protein LTR35_017946 [Friedmanniomyces endolithicus]|uniref:Uncharacterized protein n=1 Tax=Friedmanniomyces endolithicus TaxID=329885 RepID=A0AAN6F502_9PEZI|nr:hypothetical protein LTR35_017946 [Friedmanniomyces endolithicus]KAK0302458.1 hypothetical protein LTR82_017859 [Friedmanniomyces endolithicus]KAK0970402.1 hypothetical protein LTR54_017959 [Friedmanniomyces endolithicus]